MGSTPGRCGPPRCTRISCSNGRPAGRRAATPHAGWTAAFKPSSGGGNGGELDTVDARQQIDIERLINACHQLQDRVESMEAQLQQQEERGRDRAVSLRAILRDDKQMDKLLAQNEDGQLELQKDSQDQAWDSYRNSFTLLMSKGYMRSVESLRNRLMASEWELGLKPIALQLGVSRFEAFCATAGFEVAYDVISEVYDDPTDLRAIGDPRLRMHARSIITQAEAEERAKAWTACTAEAQRLAKQFTEAEFISRIIPDPIEHGMVDALRKLVVPMTRAMGGSSA